MFKTGGEFSCVYLTKRTDLTKSNSENRSPFWGTFEIPKLDFLKTKLYNSTVLMKQEWNAYFEGLGSAVSKWFVDCGSF